MINPNEWERVKEFEPTPLGCEPYALTTRPRLLALSGFVSKSISFLASKYCLESEQNIVV